MPRPASSQSVLRALYSIRIPEIARAITSCWISEVPSKIVWLTVPGFPGVALCSAVGGTWCFASCRFRLVSTFPPVSGDKTRDRAKSGHFDFATSLVRRW